ncbi:restriction endonuclease [Ectobacillus ponti]|uniref:Restriction endonuclease n=1 Tax=Ectobacillus ponti TaxID=2961894 RepID=A0AA41X915_9BACI|nr:restriction endonuclease [Ectobacillus ponti]MCP8971027.1 restriction endonuclease [Ectobacillus ponti]
MAKQRNKQKKGGILGPFLVLLLIAYVTSKELFTWLVGLSAAGLALYLYLRMRQRGQLRRSGIHDIDMMNGHEFEAYLGVMFTALGYQTQVTKGSGDFGADLVLHDGEEKIVVQAKRYKGAVGVSAVQEVVAARSYYEADGMWVITNSKFTKAAQELAQANGVVLMDRQKLIRLGLQANRGKRRAV